MAQNAKIKVVTDEQGNIIRVSKNNPEYGHIRIEQNKVQISANGWVQPKKRSALLQGKLEDLQEMEIDVNTQLTGNIVLIESFTPFNTKNPEKNLKIAGETGVICKGVDPETGEVRDIYRNTNYDSSGLKPDILIAHVNGDEIREANGNSVNVSKTEIENLTKKKKDKVKEEVPVEEPAEEVVEMEEETFEL